jgi:hypothetical protein
MGKNKSKKLNQKMELGLKDIILNLEVARFIISIFCIAIDVFIL